MNLPQGELVDDAWRTRLLLVAVANAAAFAIGTQVLGGDALRGKSVLGQYFVGSREGFSPVSELQYNYSFLHAVFVIGLFACIPLHLLLCRLRARSINVQDQ